MIHELAAGLEPEVVRTDFLLGVSRLAAWGGDAGAVWHAFLHLCMSNAGATAASVRGKVGAAASIKVRGAPTGEVAKAWRADVDAGNSEEGRLRRISKRLNTPLTTVTEQAIKLRLYVQKVRKKKAKRGAG